MELRLIIQWNPYDSAEKQKHILERSLWLQGKNQPTSQEMWWRQSPT
jgi:hypothetical protein